MRLPVAERCGMAVERGQRSRGCFIGRAWLDLTMELGAAMRPESEVNHDAMFSSKTDMWATPQDFFDRLNRLFNFNLDVCATAENAKCARFFTVADNGLAQKWDGTCWMNPPYGREIGEWVAKAYKSSRENMCTVVCLIPARTDTSWWHEYCAKGEIYFVRGRLKFGEAKNSAPFPSAVVVFRPTIAEILGTK